MKKLSILTVIMFFCALSLSGCAPTTAPTATPQPTPKPPAGAGIVEVRVTDAPAKDEVTSIVVTASKVEIHRAEDRGEWLTISIPEGSKSFDLIRIKGVEQLLTNGEVKAGKYTQIRVIIDKIEVALGGGEPKPATVPSGELKFVRPFEVVSGEATVLLLDFDADKSVKLTGKDKIQVKPVVKLNVKTGEKGKGSTQEESQEMALDFLKKEPTFVFDGMADTLKLVETKTGETPTTWTFVYEFSSAHGGYGDRTGKTVTQVITPHIAVIKVERGKVTYAVMDNQWDMLTQKPITG